ncbi:MAG: hypothetical protein HYS43_02210 [Candidatus Liptonbacteria bacterium]|nr:hypothetical protein [Candidatus Liptonbacteria bacterium]
MTTPTSGLLNRTIEFGEPSREESTPAAKVIGLGASGIACAAAFSVTLQRFAATDIPNYLWLALIAAGCFSIAFLLQTLFIGRKTTLAGFVLADTIALVGAFYAQFSIVYIIGTLAAFLILIWASIAGRRETQERLRIRFMTIAGRVFGWIVTAFAIIVTMLYISSVQFNEAPLSHQNFSRILLSANPILERIIPGLSLAQSLQQAAFALADSRTASLPPEVRQLARTQTATTLREQATRVLGVPVNQNETVINILYKGFIANTTQPTNIVFFQIAGILIFLSLKGFGFIVGIVLQPVAFLVYQVLLALGFAHIALEGRNKELIVI